MYRTWRRKTAIWGAVAVTALALPVAAAWPSIAGSPGTAPAVRTVTVASKAQLASAVARAKPGDRILVPDGTYSAPIRLNRPGTAAAPITIAAKNPGKALVTSDKAFQLDGAAHVVIEGFTFTGNGGLTVPGTAAAARITRNTFQGNKEGHWLSVNAHDTEVDHNLFRNKKNKGVYLSVTGPGSKDMAQRVRIHHNHFLNHQFSGGNGGESLRLGLSGRQHAKAFAIVEHNLFEKADGDLEAISIKSSNNIIRYNTIVNSEGTITLRHGSNSVVDGNMLIGGKTGIRIFGNDQVIVNNVVQNTSGQPISVGGGAVKDDTGSTTDHDAADRAVIAFNTIVAQRGSLISFGTGKKFGPSDITLANNILSGSGKLISKGQSTRLSWQGTIVHGGSSGDIPAGGFKAVNPQLVQGPDGLFRLKAGSPAIDAGTGSFPQAGNDIDAQTRSGRKDAGADEFSANGQRKPLTAADVGPKAP
jgi:hypothetical protein